MPSTLLLGAYLHHARDAACRRDQLKAAHAAQRAERREVDAHRRAACARARARWAHTLEALQAQASKAGDRCDARASVGRPRALGQLQFHQRRRRAAARERDQVTAQRLGGAARQPVGPAGEGAHRATCQDRWTVNGWLASHLPCAAPCCVVVSSQGGASGGPCNCRPCKGMATHLMPSRRSCVRLSSAWSSIASAGDANSGCSLSSRRSCRPASSCAWQAGGRQAGVSWGAAAQVPGGPSLWAETCVRTRPPAGPLHFTQPRRSPLHPRPAQAHHPHPHPPAAAWMRWAGPPAGPAR